MTSIAHIAEVQEDAVSSLLTETGEKCQDFLRARDGGLIDALLSVWPASACWPTTPPTRAIGWPRAATASRSVTTCARSGSATPSTVRTD